MTTLISESNINFIRRVSVSDDFDVFQSIDKIPEVTPGCARIKVCFVGVCLTDMEAIRSGRNQRHKQGFLGVDPYPGYEVSGVIDEICNKASAESGLLKGDRVIIYPDDNAMQHQRYSDMIIVSNVENLLKIPDELSLELASLLPLSGLRAYSAVQRMIPFVSGLAMSKSGATTVLIIGANGLGLWTVRFANCFLRAMNIRIVVADSNVENLLAAKEHGCDDVIHWDEIINEGLIYERTNSVCSDGVDVVVDFISSPRSVKESLKICQKGGILIMGGQSNHSISLSLTELAENSQTIVGVSRGTRGQLKQLIRIIADGLVTPPKFKVFPVAEVNAFISELGDRTAKKDDSASEMIDVNNVTEAMKGVWLSPDATMTDDVQAK